MATKAENSIEAYFQKAVQWRREIHQNPELSFREFDTAALIRNALNEMGVDNVQEITETGTVALIKGVNPENRCIGFRADIDALPIQEENDAPYKSKNKGIMHACGHDVHSAILLGFARWLCDHRDQFRGTIKLIFQPGEELLPGGASMLIEQGALEQPKVEALYALHVFPDLPAGKLGFKPGMYMASCDELHIEVRGKGGHAAMPDKLNDPILMATQLINDLQRINARHCPPAVPSVLSIGKIQANGATNVIPDKVHLEGTFRTMNEEWRKKSHELMLQFAEHIGAQNGGTIDFEIKKGYPFLKNNRELTNNAQQQAEKFLGKENIKALPLRMTAEDFAFYTHHVPCCFFRLGTGNASKKINSGVHQPTFDIDEQALKYGINAFIFLISA